MVLYCTLHKILLELPFCLLAFNLSRYSATLVLRAELNPKCCCPRMASKFSWRKTNQGEGHRAPHPPLPNKRPCLVSGGGKGTVTFHFPNFLRRLDIEGLLCVCWLDQVLLLVHVCVLQISCMEGTALHPVNSPAFTCIHLLPWADS